MLYSLLLASAWASSVYPGALETELGMPCAPTCTVCHETNGGGGGTVTRAFGIAMMDNGLLGGAATDTLTAALAAMGDVDSDGDGTFDLDELTAGADPNPDAAPFCGEDVPALVVPVYGCFGGGSAAGLVGLFGLASLRRRQRDS